MTGDTGLNFILGLLKAMVVIMVLWIGAMIVITVKERLNPPEILCTDPN